MGLSGISPMSLLLILAIAMLVFGTQRIKHIGRDLGDAVREFRNAMNDDEKKSENKNDEPK